MIAVAECKTTTQMICFYFDYLLNKKFFTSNGNADNNLSISVFSHSEILQIFNVLKFGSLFITILLSISWWMRLLISNCNLWE